MIVIGASLGGIDALKQVLQPLPATLPVPVAVVLHRYKDSDDFLIDYLAEKVALKVSEVVDKDRCRSGHVHICPADYHLGVEPGGFFSLSTDEPVQYARPSIDFLFESAADMLGPSVIGVVLTGANHDGARGAATIQRHGGRVVVQDPATAECAVMPTAALEATGTKYVASLDKISTLILELASAV